MRNVITKFSTPFIASLLLFVLLFEPAAAAMNIEPSKTKTRPPTSGSISALAKGSAAFILDPASDPVHKFEPFVADLSKVDVFGGDILEADRMASAPLLDAIGDLIGHVFTKVPAAPRVSNPEAAESFAQKVLKFFSLQEVRADGNGGDVVDEMIEKLQKDADEARQKSKMPGATSFQKAQAEIDEGLAKLAIAILNSLKDENSRLSDPAKKTEFKQSFKRIIMDAFVLLLIDLQKETEADIAALEGKGDEARTSNEDQDLLADYKMLKLLMKLTNVFSGEQTGISWAQMADSALKSVAGSTGREPEGDSRAWYEAYRFVFAKKGFITNPAVAEPKPDQVGLFGLLDLAQTQFETIVDLLGDFHNVIADMLIFAKNELKPFETLKVTDDKEKIVKDEIQKYLNEKKTKQNLQTTLNNIRKLFCNNIITVLRDQLIATLLETSGDYKATRRDLNQLILAIVNDIKAGRDITNRLTALEDVIIWTDRGVDAIAKSMATLGANPGTLLFTPFDRTVEPPYKSAVDVFGDLNSAEAKVVLEAQSRIFGKIILARFVINLIKNIQKDWCGASIKFKLSAILDRLIRQPGDFDIYPLILDFQSLPGRQGPFGRKAAPLKLKNSDGTDKVLIPLKVLSDEVSRRLTENAPDTLQQLRSAFDAIDKILKKIEDSLVKHQLQKKYENIVKAQDELIGESGLQARIKAKAEAIQAEMEKQKRDKAARNAAIQPPGPKGPEGIPGPKGPIDDSCPSKGAPPTPPPQQDSAATWDKSWCPVGYPVPSPGIASGNGDCVFDYCTKSAPDPDGTLRYANFVYNTRINAPVYVCADLPRVNACLNSPALTGQCPSSAISFERYP